MSFQKYSRRRFLATTGVGLGVLTFGSIAAACNSTGSSTVSTESGSTISGVSTLPVSFVRANVLAAGAGSLIQTDWRNHYRVSLVRGDSTVAVLGNGSDPTIVNGPQGAVFTSDGSIWLADTHNSRLIHLDPELQTIGSIATIHGIDLRTPTDIGILPSGELVVTDTGHKRLAIIDQNGNGFWTGAAVHLLPAEQLTELSWSTTHPALLNHPRSIGIDASGTITVLDSGANRIATFDSSGNATGAAFLDEPVADLAVDPGGTIVLVGLRDGLISAYDINQPDGARSLADSTEVIFAAKGQPRSDAEAKEMPRRISISRDSRGNAEQIVISLPASPAALKGN